MGWGAANGYGKPVIYLYPPRPITVHLRLSVDGTVTASLPALDRQQGWSVVAAPNGALTDLSSGRPYPYLFWEADVISSFDMSRGFVVRGRDTRPFLQDKLASLGLSEGEAHEFVEYWAPRMQHNAYNLIHFEGPAYERTARLTVTPAPDTWIRVFMVYEPLVKPHPVTPQRLTAPRRRGFVLVEWGGTEHRTE